MSGVNSQELKEALNRLAEASPRQASPGAEQGLLEAFRKRRRGRAAMLAYGAAAAACLALALGWFWVRYSPSAQTTAAPNDSYYAAPPGFVALPYAQSGVPLEEAVIVRVEVHPAELTMLGMPVTSSQMSGRISADLLVGQDGVARAVRLVQ